MYELVDPSNGMLLAVLDLAWPQGIQEGASEPVALLVNEEVGTQDLVRRAGFRYFTDVAELQAYVRRDILAMV